MTFRQSIASLVPLPRDADLLSLDVSSSAIGWSLFHGTKVRVFGLIEHPASWTSAQRIRYNTADLQRVLGAYPVSHVVMEWQSPYRAARLRNANGLAVLGQAQGFCLYMLERNWVQPTYEDGSSRIDLVSERTWTVQNGWPARKETRAAQVRLLCPEYAERVRKEPRWDGGNDVADSLGLGLWRLSIRG